MYANLNAELARNGIKIKDLAEALNISGKTMSNKLAGRTEFTLSEILVIIKMIPGASLDYLFARSA